MPTLPTFPTWKIPDLKPWLTAVHQFWNDTLKETRVIEQEIGDQVEKLTRPLREKCVKEKERLEEKAKELFQPIVRFWESIPPLVIPIPPLPFSFATLYKRGVSRWKGGRFESWSAKAQSWQSDASAFILRLASLSVAWWKKARDYLHAQFIWLFHWFFRLLMLLPGLLLLVFKVFCFAVAVVRVLSRVLMEEMNA